MAKLSPADLARKKRAGVPIVMLTSYDYPTALIEDACGVDVQLVGDSVGTNVLGRESVFQVTMDDMAHHVNAVSRGARTSLVLCDMPSGSFADGVQALRNARRLADAGADGVKMEGEEWVADIVGRIVAAGIPVCAHIGYTPQTQTKASVQGKDVDRAVQLLDAARRLQRAGAFLLVLELVPEELAREITANVAVPTIGIGAGRYCDGQVQVVHDILGLSARLFRHAKQFADAKDLIAGGLSRYAFEVRNREFPQQEHASHLSDEVLVALRERLREGAERTGSRS
jgi:3-methyl-2-oxobutanoate hydroxymethyltransferase